MVGFELLGQLLLGALVGILSVGFELLGREDDGFVEGREDDGSDDGRELGCADGWPVGCALGC